MRYRLQQGKLRPHPNGEGVRWDIVECLIQKLERVRDWFKSTAKSADVIVMEIDDTLATALESDEDKQRGGG